jgi:predicted acyltransferase
LSSTPSGLSALTLAALYWFVDVKERGERNPLFVMGRVFGANAITAYVLHSLFARLNTPVKEWLMYLMTGWGMSGELASLCFALEYTLFIYLIVWVMYKRGTFLKW